MDFVILDNLKPNDIIQLCDSYLKSEKYDDLERISNLYLNDDFEYIDNIHYYLCICAIQKNDIENIKKYLSIIENCIDKSNFDMGILYYQIYQKTQENVYFIKAIENECIDAIKNIVPLKNQKEINKLAYNDSTGKLHYLLYKYGTVNRDYHLAKAFLKNNEECIKENDKLYSITKNINKDNARGHWSSSQTNFMKFYIALFTNDYNNFFSMDLFNTVVSLELEDEMEKFNFLNNPELLKIIYRFYEKCNNYKQMARLYINHKECFYDYIGHEYFLKNILPHCIETIESELGSKSFETLFDYYNLTSDNKNVAKYYIMLLKNYAYTYIKKIINLNNEVLQFIVDNINAEGIGPLLLSNHKSYLESINKNINNIDFHKMLVSKCSSVSSLQYLFENGYDVDNFIDKLRLLCESEQFEKLKDHENIQYRVIYYEKFKSEYKNELFAYYFEQKNKFEKLLKESSSLIDYEHNYKKYKEYKNKLNKYLF